MFKVLVGKKNQSKYRNKLVACFLATPQKSNISDENSENCNKKTYTNPYLSPGIHTLLLLAWDNQA